MAVFEVRLPDWEIEEGVHVDLVVAGDCAAGVCKRRPDRLDWVELDVRSIEISNAKRCPMPPTVVGQLCAQDRFLQAVEEAILKEGL